MRKLLLMFIACGVACLAFSQTYRVREVKEVLKSESKGKFLPVKKWDDLSSTTQLKSRQLSGKLSVYDCQTRRLFELEITDKPRLLSEYVSGQDHASSSALSAVIRYIQKEYSQLNDDHYQMFHSKGGTTRGLSLTASSPFLHKSGSVCSDSPMMVAEFNKEAVSRLIIVNPFQQARFAYVLLQTQTDILFLPLSGNECALPVPPGEKEPSAELYFTSTDYKNGFKLSLLWSDYLLSKEDRQQVLQQGIPSLENCFWFECRQ